MARVLMSLFLVFVLACPAFADWEPPAEPDVDVIWDEIGEDLAAERHKTALSKILWFHNHALEYNPAMTGVRLSYALSRWKSLAEVYEPAKKAMEETYARTEEELFNRLEVKQEPDMSNPFAAMRNGPFPVFHDLVALNRTMDREDRTVALFKRVREQDKQVAAQVYPVARDSLLKAEAYEMCGEYIKPALDLARAKELLEMHRDMAKQRQGKHGKHLLQYADQHYRYDIGVLVALLVKNDRAEEATEIAEQAQYKVNVEGLDKTLESALKGEVPTN